MRNGLVYGALVSVICSVCYYNSINCGFVFDDISAIKDNKDLRPSTPIKQLFYNDFWGTPIHKEHSHKSYRPFCVLTFRWNYYLHGLDPKGYHVVNVALHIIVCIMYYWLCRLFCKESWSSIAGILFAVHPIHTEAVTGVVGRAEILSSIFFLLAFQCYVKAGRNAAKTDWLLLLCFSLCVGCAMLCKEQGVTVVGLCVVYELIIVQNVHRHCLKALNTAFSKLIRTKQQESFKETQATKRILFLIATTAALISGRLYIMKSTLPIFTKFDNPASVATTPTRQLTYNYLSALNFWLLLFPNDLCCDWTMGTVPLVERFLDVRNLATVTTYTLVVVSVWMAIRTENKMHSNVLVIGLSLIVLPYIPASNLLFPVGFVVAERVLYMPSMGFCLLVSYGYHILLNLTKQTKILKCLLVMLLIGHAAKTYNRNIDWENEYSIFMSGLRVNQKNAKLFNNVGHALESSGKYEDALLYFKSAAKVQPDDIGAYINVGRTYNNLKLYEKAEEAYLKAKSLLPRVKPGESYKARIAPNYLNVFINLANLISKNHSRLEEADLLYRQAISMRDDYTQAYINRGDILMKLNRTEEARLVYERASMYDETNPDIYYNLGVVALEQDKTPLALSYFDKALALDPEHEQSLLNSAIILQGIGGEEYRKTARKHLKKLLGKNDQNERVYFNLGMLAMDEQNITEAEIFFKRAIELKDDFRSALFNLALILVDHGNPLDAIPYLKKLIQSHPEHVKGLILLGDIYINHIKDLDAAKNCYDRILEIEPLNIQALHNLCVVYIEKGELARAIKCLKYAHSVGPTEEYIVRHLKIVEARYEKLKQESEKFPNFIEQEEDNSATFFKTSDEIDSSSLKNTS